MSMSGNLVFSEINHQIIDLTLNMNLRLQSAIKRCHDWNLCFEGIAFAISICLVMSFILTHLLRRQLASNPRGSDILA
jgi:hypothetical protein